MNLEVPRNYTSLRTEDGLSRFSSYNDGDLSGVCFDYVSFYSDLKSANEKKCEKDRLQRERSQRFERLKVEQQNQIKRRKEQAEELQK